MPSRNGGSLVPRSLFYLLVNSPTIMRSEGEGSNLSNSAVKLDPKEASFTSSGDCGLKP